MSSKKNPKRGEARKSRQPFAIDRLPESWHQKIISRRAAFRTWDQIEEESSKWQWESLPPELRVLFKDERIPHSNLARWYDVRVEQVTREAMAEAEASRQIVAAFAGKDFAGLETSVKNALADQVFALMRSAETKDRQKFAGALAKLGIVLSEMKRADAASEKVKLGRAALDLEIKKFEQAQAKLQKAADDAKAKLSRGKALTGADIDDLVVKTFGFNPRSKAAGSATA